MEQWGGGGGIFLVKLNLFFVFRKPVDIAKILSRVEEDKYEDLDMMEKVIAYFKNQFWIRSQ